MKLQFLDVDAVDEQFSARNVIETEQEVYNLSYFKSIRF